MAGVSYKVKAITFMNRKVPIMMQNENGPCPLLALANVMLLRNHISLPLGTMSVSQERLIALVAGRMLDTNNEERLSRMTEEHAASLRQNLSDAVSHLTTLTTGVDVNPRFTGIGSFEFTKDIAIFDLLDIRLVHGWLVDPQFHLRPEALDKRVICTDQANDQDDRQTMAAVGRLSYNELISALVFLTGQDASLAQTPSGTSLQSRTNSLHQQDSSKELSDAQKLQIALRMSLDGSPSAGRLEMSMPVQDRSSPGAASRAQGSDQLYEAERSSESALLRDPSGCNHPTADRHLDLGRIQEEDDLQKALELSRLETGAWEEVKPHRRQSSAARATQPRPPTGGLHSQTPARPDVRMSASQGNTQELAKELAESLSSMSLSQRPSSEQRSSLPTVQHPSGSAPEEEHHQRLQQTSTASKDAGGGSPKETPFQARDHQSPSDSGAGNTSRDLEGHENNETRSETDAKQALDESTLRSVGKVDQHEAENLYPGKQSAKAAAHSEGISGHTGLNGDTGTSSVGEGLPGSAQERPDSAQRLQAGIGEALCSPPAESSTSALDVQQASSSVPQQAGGDSARDPGYTHFEERDLVRMDSATLAKGKMTAFSPLQGSHLDGSTASKALADSRRSLEQHDEELQKATVMRAFLDRNSSQLTEHGILCLHQGLRSNELSILFRNNHFTTIFFHEGAIWMLATDQGFLYEADIVWERLTDVGGNNDFVGSTFKPFKAHTFGQNFGTDSPITRGGNDDEASIALALQLQEEEQMYQQHYLAQQPETQGNPSRDTGQGWNAGQASQPPRPPQGSSGRPAADTPAQLARGSRSRASRGRDDRAKKESCTIM